MITENELLEFFAEDSPEEIAGYMSANMRSLANGNITVEDFINMHKPEDDNEIQ